MRPIVFALMLLTVDAQKNSDDDGIVSNVEFDGTTGMWVESGPKSKGGMKEKETRWGERWGNPTDFERDQ